MSMISKGKRAFRFPGWLVALALSTTPVLSHEFWLDAEESMIEAGDSISIDMRVGQNFSGRALAYLSQNVREIRHWSPGAVTSVHARLGDRPAVQSLVLEEPGLHRITLATKPSYIVFETLEEFREYLEYEGLSHIAELHEARGFASTDIAEAYVRNARTLVQVGPVTAADADEATGMAFELVATGNPFVPERETLEFELLWQGEPVTQAQVAIFHVARNGKAPNDTMRRLVQTDAVGRASIDNLEQGRYLLNAVRLEPVEGPGAVVWESHWASLTFEIPPN